MHGLAGNAAITHCARRAGMSIVGDSGDADAHRALCPASAASLTPGSLSDPIARFDFALESHVDALGRAARASGR